MFNRINSNDIAQVRWIKCYNLSNETAPGGAVAKRFSYSPRNGVNITKPDSYSDPYAVIVGPQDIPPQSYGICTYDDVVPAYVLLGYSSGANPAGALVGTKPNSWFLHGGRSGFILEAHGIVRRQRQPCFTGVRWPNPAFLGSSLPSGAWTNFTSFDTPEYDYSYDGPWYGATDSYGLRITKSGYYLCGLQYAFRGVVADTSLRGLWIDLNTTGTTVTDVGYRMEAAQAFPTTTVIQVGGAFRVPTSSTSYSIRIRAYQASGSSMSPYGSYSCFWVTRMPSAIDPYIAPANPTFPV